MKHTTDQLAVATRDNLASMQVLAARAHADVARLVELNLATSRELLNDSFEYAKAAMQAKDAQDLLTLQAGMAQPIAQKLTAYAQQVQTIVAEAGAQFNMTVEANLAQAQKGLASLMEGSSKNTPVGSESVVALFNNAMNAGQSALRMVQNTAQQAVEAAQSSMAAISDQNIDSVKRPTRRA